MGRLIFIVFLFVCFGVILLAKNLQTMRAVYMVRFFWTALCTFLFFYFYSPYFTHLQNSIAGAFAVIVLVYFGYHIVRSVNDDA